MDDAFVRIFSKKDDPRGGGLHSFGLERAAGR
jgi:hypothetical protein